MINTHIRTTLLLMCMATGSLGMEELTDGMRRVSFEDQPPSGTVFNGSTWVPLPNVATELAATRPWQIKTSRGGWITLDGIPEHVLAGLERNEIGIYERDFRAQFPEEGGPRRYRVNPHTMLQTNISPWMPRQQQETYTRQIRPQVIADPDVPTGDWEIRTQGSGWVDSRMPQEVRQALDRRQFAVYSRMVGGQEFWYKVDGDLMRQYNITPWLDAETRAYYTRTIRPSPTNTHHLPPAERYRAYAGQDCAICIETLGTYGGATAAGHGSTSHVFCHECLARYMSHQGEQAKCPECREWIDETYRYVEPEPVTEASADDAPQPQAVSDPASDPQSGYPSHQVEEDAVPAARQCICTPYNPRVDECPNVTTHPSRQCEECRALEDGWMRLDAAGTALEALD